MAEKYRVAVVWHRSDAPQKDECWYVDFNNPNGETGTPAKVIHHIIKYRSCGGLSADEISAFINDAQAGNVKIAYGKNIRLDEPEKMPHTVVQYTNIMHSVNNFNASLYTKELNENKSLGYGYGFGYVIFKEEELNDEEKNIISECKNIVLENDKSDISFRFIELLISLIKETTLFETDYSTPANYGRLDNTIKFDTEDVYTYKDAKEKLDKITEYVTNIYDEIANLFGYRLYQKLEDGNLIEFPEVLLSSRNIRSTKLQAVKFKEVNKPLCEIYQQLLDDHMLDKTNCNKKFRCAFVLGDDSASVIEHNFYGKDKYMLDLSKVSMDSFKSIPDCIAFSDGDGDDDEGIDRIVIWGDTKDLYDTMGGEAFLKIATRTKK